MTSAVATPRRSRLARWSWALLLVGGVAAYLIVLRTTISTDNLNFIPSLILLGSIVVPAAVLVFAASGPQAPVRPDLLVAVAVVGGIFGTVAAGTLEYDTLRRLGTVPMLGVGLIEEASKLVVPIAVLLLTRDRNPAHGVVIGVASGAGFATLETMGYGFGALVQQRSLAALDDTLLLRALLAPAGHVAWTGLTVAAIWAVPGAARRGRAVLVAVGVFLAAVLLHAAWDGLGGLVPHVVVGLVSFAALLVVIHRSHRGRRAHPAAPPGAPAVPRPEPSGG
jgi:protease PrsW